MAGLLIELPTMVNVSPLSTPSWSLARTSKTLSVLSSATVSLSLTATGSSLTLVTVIEYVAVFESTVPSYALKVKLSEPK